MGNLARPGYAATTEGMWPYTFVTLSCSPIHLLISLATSDSYNTCDLGTFPNQTLKDKSGPAAALHSDASRTKYNMELSWLPGQRARLVTSPTPSSRIHPGFSLAPALAQAQIIPDQLSLKAAAHPRLTSWKPRRAKRPPVRPSPRAASLHLSLTTTPSATLRPTNTISTPLISQSQMRFVAALCTYLHILRLLFPR